MKETKDLVKNYWSKRADEYSHARFAEYNGDTGIKWKKVLEMNFPEKTNCKVLDAGTGGGLFAFLMQDLGGDVTAIDYSPEMIKNAKRNMERLGKTDISFLEMDVMDLSFSDACFDFIFTHNVTWILSDPARAYTEMLRVLKPGGILVNVDANYGKAFQYMDDHGLTERTADSSPSKYAHPYRSAEMIRERNDLAESLYISKVNRPAWDIEVLLSIGVSEVQVISDMENRFFGKERQDRMIGEPQFLIKAVKQ